jgi:glycerol-1-phosphate dehydrogenase [NAD(P)+]
MAAGAPVDPEQIGITRQRLRESFYKAQKLRTRFTVLDLALRTGYLDTWVEELFGENGVLKPID